MNLNRFFEHWKIAQNPFRVEEARHDAGRGGGRVGGSVHSDFEKIMGGPDQPSTAIVFGEKGSGKTAIRLQIESRIREHNRSNPSSRVFLVPYDDLNVFLDHVHERYHAKDPLDSLEKLRLVDHMDAILSVAVGSLVTGVVGGPDGGRDPEMARAARRMPLEQRRDLVLLQAVYGQGTDAAERTGRLRRALSLWAGGPELFWRALSWAGWIPGAALLAWSVFPGAAAGVVTVGPTGVAALRIAGLVLLALWLIVPGKRLVWDRFAASRVARRLRRQMVISDRPEASYARALTRVPRELWSPGQIPVTGSDEARYAMLDRLRRVLRALGYSGMLVLIDRVDEPTLISGDARRMRAVIWPMLNNKFLQQEGFGIKMLLPIELRHLLFRESSAFFQEARLDKQNLVERLSWTGAMLYDLCEARLRACREEGAGEISLLDLFEEDVTGRDVVDALDQMHQPRDAFKFLYRCLTEHCSNVTEGDEKWRVPRLVLEGVKKQESERLQGLYRGIRPA
jgi:hypothetical protein